MKKIEATWGMGREWDKEVLEFDDNATEEEIEREVREYVMQYFEWYWERVD